MNIEISWDELRKRKLFIAMPCYGGQMYTLTTKSLLDLHSVCLREGHMDFRFFAMFNESLVTRARNYCADEFLNRSDCTHLLFVDSDIEFAPTAALTLLALADPNSNYDVVCAPYPKKNISWEKIVTAVEKGVHKQNPNALEHFMGDLVFNPIQAGTYNIQSPTQVKESGTGFMMIQRHVFEKLAKLHPELSYSPDHVRSKAFDGSRKISCFFNTPIVDERFLSEDYDFCRLVREAGMKVWLCPWIPLNHLGYYKFVGNMQALAFAEVSPTADLDKIKKD